MALCAQRVAAWHKRHQMPSLLADGALAPDALRGGFGLARGFGRHIPFCKNLHFLPRISHSTSIREAKFIKLLLQERYSLIPGTVRNICVHFVVNIVTILCRRLASFHEVVQRLFDPRLAVPLASSLGFVREFLSEGHSLGTIDAIEHKGLSSQTARGE